MMYGPSLFGPLHALGALVFFLGLLFLVIWAVRTFSAARLRTWGVWMLAIGLLLCVLTFVGGKFHRGMDGRFGMMMGRDKCGPDDEVCMIEKDLHMMEKGEMKGGMMMKKEDGMGGMMMHGDDMMDMSMDDMAAMLDGKTGDAFDQAFIEGMIPHHQGAIDMAKDALVNAKHEELKALARDIIASQQAEIDRMEGWLQAWGYAGTGATR